MSNGQHRFDEPRLGKSPRFIPKSYNIDLARVGDIIFPDRPDNAIYSERSKHDNCWIIKIDDDNKGLTYHSGPGLVCMLIDQPLQGEVVYITKDSQLGTRFGEVGTMINNKFVPRLKRKISH